MEIEAIIEKYAHPFLQGLKAATSNLSDYKKYLDFGFNIHKLTDKFYVPGSPKLKNQILCSMYSENLFFDGNKYRIPVYSEGLVLILATARDLEENEEIGITGLTGLCIIC